MLWYAKGAKQLVCIGLTVEEAQCQCAHPSCRSVWLTRRLVDAYSAFRVWADCFLTIRSCHRCALHNASPTVKGKPQSRHQSGEAIDIELAALYARGFTKEQIEAALLAAGFTFVLFYEDFVHADTRVVVPFAA